LPFVPCTSALTKVGATLRFLAGACSILSSFSDSLAAVSLLPSTLAPLTELARLAEVADIGVCGGVVIRVDPTAAELVAVTLGTLPSVGVGLLVIVMPGGSGWCPKESCVATEDAEEVRVGLAGRIDDAVGVAEGVMESLLRAGAVDDVGVGAGVDCVDDALVLTTMG
jgi:hypothetical protein